MFGDAGADEFRLVAEDAVVGIRGVVGFLVSFDGQGDVVALHGNMTAHYPIVHFGFGTTQYHADESLGTRVVAGQEEGISQFAMHAQLPFLLDVCLVEYLDGFVDTVLAG